MRFWILVRGRGRIYIKFIKFLPALFENLFSEVVFLSTSSYINIECITFKNGHGHGHNDSHDHGHGHAMATVTDTPRYSTIIGRITLT